MSAPDDGASGAGLPATTSEIDLPDLDLTGEGPPDSNNIIPLPQVSEGVIPLGYDRGIFYYLSRATRQVHAMTPDQHTKKALMGMASVPRYWQRTKFVSAKGNIRWDDASDWLMSSCHGVGIYNPERVRGRGAWYDNGRSVLHMGDRLIVDGRDAGLMLPGSSAIYPAALALPIEPAAAPLSATDANRLKILCEQFRWDKPIYGKLFAGWIVCAMICGALKWRPSVWITGASGSGKSWLLENILTPLIGPIALQVLSKTSEAGIRQTLNSDALPVIFDEFESEDRAAATRVQGVLDLMRQSSTESEKKIIKGTQQQQTARAFRVRSCFVFSSVNVGVVHAADENRLTVLSLQPPANGDETAAEAFARLEEGAAWLITPAYAAGLLARSVALVEVIRANAETFSAAVARSMGTRRMGDQLGAMLAGAYSLRSSGPVQPDEALDWLGAQDWGDTTQAEEKDEERLLATLMSHRVRVTRMTDAGKFGQEGTVSLDMTLGRLVNASYGYAKEISATDATAELRDYGIRVETTSGLPSSLLVSTNHPALAKILRDTPWSSQWSRSLARLPGAETYQKNWRFGLGVLGKGVRVPISAIDRGELEGS